MGMCSHNFDTDRKFLRRMGSVRLAWLLRPRLPPYDIFTRRMAILSFCFFTSLVTQASEQEMVDPRDRPVIWIASAQGRPTLLLLPTIHLLEFEGPRVDARLSRLVDKVTAVVVETSEAELKSKWARLKSYTMYPADDNLTNHTKLLTPEELAGCALREGRPLVQFLQFKPWLAASDIETHRVVSRVTPKGLAATSEIVFFAGIDRRLNALATQDHKPLIALETPEEAFGMLDSIPASRQDAWLSDACSGETGSTAAEISLGDLERAWLSGDFREIEPLLAEIQPGESAEMYQINQYIFMKGNENFIYTIEKDGFFHGRGPILVAVGAGHFFGRTSLINLLKADGYLIEPPPNSR